MDLIQPYENILLVWDSSFDLEASGINTEILKAKFGASIKFENVQRLHMTSYGDSIFTLIILKVEQIIDIQLLASLLKLLKPSGRISTSIGNTKETLENLKLAGFVNIINRENDILAEKPKYEIGSAAKLSFGKNAITNNKISTVWKLLDEDDDDLINENDLLDEKDKMNPDPSNLKVCGTTGKRKACKDCSCGLAEELGSDGKNQTVKSSCGSCYLGDAFRCATCPYYGMPAFKQGEKVQLSGGLLKDDL